MASINESVSDCEESRRRGVLTLTFNIRFNRKYGLLKPEIANLEVDRTAPARLKDLLEHLFQHLRGENNGINQLLLKAVCDSKPTRNKSHSSAVERTWNPSGLIPLVCDQIWSGVLMKYPHHHLEILVNQYVPEIPVHTVGCMPKFFNRELKYLDVTGFLPTKNLKSSQVVCLCQKIFEHGVKIKPELRKGVWMHLVGVFHPGLRSREEREQYIGKLRMVYDHLKGKLVGENDSYYERRQLVDAVHRDAIRTDPGNPFFANYRRAEESYISQHYHQSDDEENNIQKLINIIVIYTMEHGDISYTQGMTDILSPILYTMKKEADAYICFAAMVERIKLHFGQWCTGTLHKLERLRHLCEVLDPDLYRYLDNIEEDAFVLFFGMVLIECRREFSFEDSFHLLETIWAGTTCITDSCPSLAKSTSAVEWARYMTCESPEVLHQVFEGSGVPYSAVPLPHAISGSYSIGPQQYSRNPSLLSQSPLTQQKQSGIQPSNAIIAEEHSPSHSPAITPLSINCSISFEDLAPVCAEIALAPHAKDDISTPTLLDSRLRSQSESNLQSISSQNGLNHKKSPLHVKSTSLLAQQLRTGSGRESILSNKLANQSFSHSESELYDSFSNSKIMVQPRVHKNSTEMSDMSSISSGTTSANGGLLSSLRSVDGRKSVTQNHTPVDGSSSKTKLSPMIRRHSTSTHSTNSKVPNNHGGKLLIPGVSSDTESARDLETNGPLPDRGVQSSNPPIQGAVGSRPSEPASPGTINHDSSDATITNSPTSNPQPQNNPVVNRTAENEHSSKKNKGLMRTHAKNDTANVPLEDVDHSLRDMIHLQQGELLIEHSGMITNISHRSPLVPHQTKPRHQQISEKTHPLSDGLVIQHRRSSPKRIQGRRDSIDDYSDEISSSHRVTPVAFFDTMEKLAESAPWDLLHFSSRGHHWTRRDADRESSKRTLQDRTENDTDKEIVSKASSRSHQRNNSDTDLSLIMSQIISTEEGAPRVTREQSLSIPFSDCYSLFICLAILVQKREEIMQSDTDFYQLSAILNSQTGCQNLDVTLKVALNLYRKYKKYQSMCFGGYDRYSNTWLDDTQVMESEHNQRTGQV